MSNVLEFLERVGQDWQLRHADPATLTQVMVQAGVDATLHPAILARDAQQLATLLHLDSHICCAVHPAHEDEDETADDDDEEFDEEDFDEADFDDDEEDLIDDEDDQ